MLSYKFFGPVLHIIGILLTALGIVMLIPALVDWLSGDTDWSGFIGASVITLTVSGGMIFATRDRIRHFSVKQTFLLTTLSWLVLGIFGALPFVFSGLGLSVTDSLFESMSGLTTTGATILTDLDNTSSGILLWRALLHWCGGVGIIVMALAILPILGIGGMQLFQTESSDRGDKTFTRVREIATGIALTYLILTLFAMVLFILTGMSVFDALCHAMSAIATGGFSTHNDSFGYFGSLSTLWVAILSMVMAALPLTYYIRLAYSYEYRVFFDSQVVTLLMILVVVVLVLTFWRMNADASLWGSWEVFTHTAFNVTSIVTSSGFSSEDYSQWGGFPLMLFFILFFIGGCTGSTSGSIKIFRWQILTKVLFIQVLRMRQPHRVMLPLYQGRRLSEDVLQSVVNYVMAVIFCLVVVALTFTALGLDLVTSISAAAAAITNVGPGLGPVVGPAGNYASLPDLAKLLMCGVMVMGRLEVFTVIILFTTKFWKA